MTDPFTTASPTYIAAQRTNQAKGHGWNFSPDHDEPVWVKALCEVLRPRSIVIFSVLAAVVALWWM